MTVPYSFANATVSIPLSQLDANFNTPITLGNTAIQLGNTVTTLNNMTLANVTISSGNVTITNVSVTTANVTTGNITNMVSGNVTITGGSINGTTLGATTASTANVTTLTTSSTVTINGGTANGVAYLNGSKVLTTGSALTFDGARLGVGISPSQTIDANGAILSRSNLIAYTALVLQRSSSSLELPVATYTNGSGSILSGGTKGDIVAFGNAGGDGVIFANSNAEAMRLTSTGLGIGTSSPSGKLDVAGASDGDNVIRASTNSSNGIIIIRPDGANGNVLRWGGNGANANTFRFISGGELERMRIDSSGNLGLGVTPSAWSTFGSIFQGTGYALAGFSSGSNVQSALFCNSFFNGSNHIYRTTAAASEYLQISGQHQWFTAPSGNAGDTISFTQAMTLDASGNLLVGTTTSATRNITVGTTNASIALAGANGGIYFGATGTPVGSGGFGVNAAIARAGGANFHITGSADGDLCIAPEGTKAILFGTSASASSVTERARITSGGNLLVGTTSDTPAQSNVSGFKVGGGQIECNGTDTQAAFFGRSNDGQVIRFYNAGAAAGNISNTGTTTSYNGTSDYRLKENIQPMVGALEKVAALKPCTYTWKVDGRLGQGFIAHELQEVIPDAVQGTKDEVDENGNPEYQGIDPRMIVATLTAAIQELKAQNDDLRARVAALESQA